MIDPKAIGSVEPTKSALDSPRVIGLLTMLLEFLELLNVLHFLYKYIGGSYYKQCKVKGSNKEPFFVKLGVFLLFDAIT